MDSLRELTCSFEKPCSFRRWATDNKIQFPLSIRQLMKEYANEFEFNISPTIISLHRKETAALKIQVEPKGGYDQSISVIVNNIPADITISTLTISPLQNEGQISITTGPSPHTCDKSVQVVASGINVYHREIVRSKNLTLHVIAPSLSHTNDNPSADHVTLFTNDDRWKVDVKAFKTSYFVYKEIGSSVRVQNWNEASQEWKDNAANYISITNTYSQKHREGSYTDPPKESRGESFLELKMWAFFASFSVDSDLVDYYNVNKIPGGGAKLEIDQVASHVQVQIGNESFNIYVSNLD